MALAVLIDPPIPVIRIRYIMEYIYLQLDQLFSQRLCHCSFTGAAFWTP
jgi:hypothetical protein